MCANNIKSLGVAMNVYANDYKGLYPTSSKWCDLLIEKEDVDPKMLRCPGADKSMRSSYAMNKNMENLGPGAGADMVLLFETTDGWNQSGGPEILSTCNHQGDGCNVVFNDGHVEFIKSKDLENLRWVADQNDLGPSAFLLPGHL
jgi:prepilin-type processing-associated H-X9-DG protein